MEMCQRYNIVFYGKFSICQLVLQRKHRTYILMNWMQKIMTSRQVTQCLPSTICEKAKIHLWMSSRLNWRCKYHYASNMPKRIHKSLSHFECISVVWFWYHTLEHCNHFNYWNQTVHLVMSCAVHVFAGASEHAAFGANAKFHRNSLSELRNDIACILYVLTTATASPSLNVPTGRLWHKI